MDENDQPRDKKGRFSQKKKTKGQNIRLSNDEYNLIQILRSPSFVTEKMRLIFGSLGEFFSHNTPDPILFYSGILNKSFKLFLENFGTEEGLSWHHLGLDTQVGPSKEGERLKTGRWIPDTTPTIGMNAENIRIGEFTLSAWDLGGQLQFRRALWEMSTKNMNGIFFVIDLNDKAAFPKNRRYLSLMMKLTPQKNIPLAILTAFDARFQSENTINCQELFGVPPDIRCQVFPFELDDHLSFRDAFHIAYGWMTGSPLILSPFRSHRLLPSLLLIQSESRNIVNLESIKGEYQLSRSELESLLVKLSQIYLQLEE